MTTKFPLQQIRPTAEDAARQLLGAEQVLKLHRLGVRFIWQSDADRENYRKSREGYRDV